MIINKIKIKNLIKKRVGKYNIIQNINKDFSSSQKKVLISYIIKNFETNYDNETVQHTNCIEINQIIKKFIDLNYCIDVVYCNEDIALEKVANKTYDVVFGMGDNFIKASTINNDAKKILYLTENNPKYSYKNEVERINYYYERHKIKVPITRSSTFFNKEHLNIADTIIYLGDNNIQLYNKEKFGISPTGFINNRYKNMRNYEKTKKNFLWFGSSGAIHKGLDLLIDIFSKRDDINLYICGFNKNEKRYLKIPKKDNIIDCGRLDIKSDKYLEIINKCSFLLFPSCSEAMSTSVLTSMLHGMIPVVIKNSGLNKLGDNAFYFENYKLDNIEDKINELLTLDVCNLHRLHTDIYNYALDNYTICDYTKNINKILDEILSR